MRLDKFICECTSLSRSDAKKAIKNKRIKVNDDYITKAEFPIDESKDSVFLDGKALNYEKYVYFMLNKPAGCVTATEDNLSLTVMDVLNEKEYKDLFPVGRLDKDTRGLLLITNDGELAHRLLSPRKTVYKDYFVICRDSFTDDMKKQLERGVDINDETNTLPAVVKEVHDRQIVLSICEGRFHEVKRMLKAVGNEVLELKRLSMGTLFLDETLKEGDHRRLYPQELAALYELVGL